MARHTALDATRSTDPMKTVAVPPGDDRTFAVCPTPLVNVDARNRCVAANAAARQLLGDDIAQRRWSSLVHPDDCEAMAAAIRRSRQSGRAQQIDVLLGRSDASWTWVRTRTVPIDGGIVMMALTDIDLVKKLEGRVARLATVDEVTGLLNRSGLEEALFDALRDCDPDTRALVATVDLDGFDGLNASFGHDAGDLALLGVAARLRSEVGEDALVGRYGDDEFAVAVVPAHGSPDAFADKLREVFATPFDLNGTAVVVDASIGILDAACRSCSPERLLRRAADALRSAKSSSGTSVAFFEESVASARSYDGELQVEILDDDLATNLIVEYQPIISVRAGTTFGLEALVRWRHPVRGVIGPDEFIPAAERTGRISCVTRHVLRTACHQLTAWDRTGATTDLTIGVNVSARDLVDAGFEEFVLDVLAECDLDPGRLHLEVTESHMMENLDDAVDLLAALSAAGVGISIDDFGTGYSSLSYLTRLPATTVKIDRSFISGIDGDAADEDVRRSRSMVGAVTSLAHSLGFQVVAEGVETPAQLDEVRRLGCDLVQGFVHSTPLDATSPELLGFVGNGEPWASEDR